jgi:hypothetical protein
MSSTPIHANAAPSSWERLQRWLGRWWVHQPAARQDRLVTLAPLVSVLLFLAAIISAFWYLRNEEIERETESLKRDTEIAQQQIRLHLIENQELLVRMASELVKRETDADDFAGQALGFVRERPTVTSTASAKRAAGPTCIEMKAPPATTPPIRHCRTPRSATSPRSPLSRPAICASRCTRAPSSTAPARPCSRCRCHW